MSEKPPARLLAKSYKRHPDKDPPPYALLERHTRDVAEAGGTLINAVGQIAFDCAALDPALFEEFALALKANCYIQDFGKANSHFHQMLFTPGFIQLIRHEALSGLLFTREPLRKWFSQLRVRQTLRLTALWGAIGHHRKFHRDTRSELGIPAADVFVTHTDFQLMLKTMKKALGFQTDPPSFERDLIVSENDRGHYNIAADDALFDLQDEFDGYKKLFAAEEDRRMLALIKGFGIAADVAASAIGKREGQEGDYSVANSIRNFTEASLTSDDLQQLIVKRAWDTAEVKPPTKEPKVFPPQFEFNDLQRKAEKHATRYLTLVQAGCGSGKSLFAYKWAKGWCGRLETKELRAFRLFFLLPTTGTATEHYKDYALEAGIEDTALTHSRASIDLEQIAETSQQEEASEAAAHDMIKAAREALKAKKDKAEALELWSTRIIVGTADTVLGLMANALRSICALPAIISSAIVFDEIHAYDEEMFGHLLVFLKNFPRLPVLLMTASLPDVRLRAIKLVRKDLMKKDIIKNSGNFETLPRYRINRQASDQEVWDDIEKTISQNGKVLWVRNQVEWANEGYRESRRHAVAVLAIMQSARRR
jgi:CRISPR-associated endonuclease/helicase Cas3